MKLRMTKASLFAIVVIVLLLLTACAPPPQERVDVEANEEQEFKVVKRLGGNFSGRVITQDSETGCMYIEVTEGISPYYGKDGEVEGCFENESNSKN